MSATLTAEFALAHRRLEIYRRKFIGRMKIWDVIVVQLEVSAESDKPIKKKNPEIYTKCIESNRISIGIAEINVELFM
jgi:hypothetical protein